MVDTLIILNPHAAGGRAGELWSKLERRLWDLLGGMVVAITQTPEDVGQYLDEAYQVGLTRVISIGGDGTNHSIVNALINYNHAHPASPQMIYGTLPIGTGRDWARSMGIPFDVEKAAEWLANARPSSVDIGLLTVDGQHEYFLNIASAGLGGDVSMRVNRTRNRRPWTFLKSTVMSLLQYSPQPMSITLDDDLWYDGTVFAAAIANGTTFGHGMNIAPDAQINDGLFDIVLVEGMPKIDALLALRRVYDGSHLTHPRVQHTQAKRVQITSEQGPVSIELDGEVMQGNELLFEIKPGMLQMLL